MLSAALRGAPSVGPQYSAANSVQPKLPPVLQSSPAPPARGLASSLTDEPIFEQIVHEPAFGVPLTSRPSVHAAEVDVDVDAVSEEGDIFGADEDFHDSEANRSASSSQTNQASFLDTPNVPGPMAGSLTATSAHLLSAGPSGEFVIGRAVGARGSAADLQAELEHITSCGGGRGSRPIGIPRCGPFMGAATYHAAPGAFMAGFVPPHELAAASVQDSEAMVVHSHRHKSTAERLRTAVFEQTGHMSLTTAAAFLQTSAHYPQGRK